MQYSAQTIPMIANSFQLTSLPVRDTTDFKLIFLVVVGGNICNYQIDIPYSSIIIT